MAKAFTLEDIRVLREKTGVGLPDAKKAMTEAGGNMDRAIQVLRERSVIADELASTDMACPYCNAALPKNMSFCGKCGKAIVPSAPAKKVCPTCGYANEPDMNFCIMDGAPLDAPADTNAPYMVLIKEFLEIMSNDAKIKAKTLKKDISIQITFKDNEESCYIHFNKGEINTGLGVCPFGAKTKLSIPFKIFDAWMTNTGNAANAAAEGKMTFTGNVLALRILGLAKDSYQKAAEKAGKLDIG